MSKEDPGMLGSSTGNRMLDGMIFNELSTMFSRATNWNKMRESKDIDKECGYPSAMTAHQYKEWFCREPIAQRVVTIYPEETWAKNPEISENQDPDNVTDWEIKFKRIEKRTNLFSFCERLDIVSGIGRFGVMFFGWDDGNSLESAIPEIEAGIYKLKDTKSKRAKPLNLMYVRVFDETLVKIVKYVNNPRSPRNGLPELYEIQFGSPEESGQTGADGVAASAQPSMTYKVHWTRVHHYADNKIASEIFGNPRQEVCINRMFDVRKVSGGSAEMFWQGAFPGISFETNPNLLNDAEVDQKALRAEMKRYSEGLQRYLAIVGVSAKSLAPQVADPRNHVDVQLLLISMAIRTPLRILLGSEEARLASSQDMLTWNKRLFRRQEKKINPEMLIPILEMLMMVGALPFLEDWFIDWPDLNTPTDSDRADMAMKMSSAIFQYITGHGALIVPPMHFLTLVLGFDIPTAQVIMKKTGMDMKKLIDMVKELTTKPEPGPASKKKGGIGGGNAKEKQVGGT